VSVRLIDCTGGRGRSLASQRRFGATVVVIRVFVGLFTATS